MKKNTNQIHAGSASAKRGARIVRALRFAPGTRWVNVDALATRRGLGLEVDVDQPIERRVHRAGTERRHLLVGEEHHLGERNVRPLGAPRRP